MSTSHHDHAALVGWTAQRLGDRLILRMQSVTKPPPHASADVHTTHLLMDRQQAIQMANFMFEMFDETKPPRRSGWLARVLGR